MVTPNQVAIICSIIFLCLAIGSILGEKNVDCQIMEKSLVYEGSCINFSNVDVCQDGDGVDHYFWHEEATEDE